MPIQMLRSEKRDKSEALIGIKQTLKDLDARTTLTAKISLIKEVLSESTLEILKDEGLYEIRALADRFTNEAQTDENYKGDKEVFDSISQKLDRYIKKTETTLPALIKTKLYEADFEYRKSIEEIKVDIAACESVLESMKSELSIQGVCLEATESLCMDLKTKQPIDPTGEPTQTNIRDAFLQIIHAKCPNQSDQATKYLTAKFTANTGPHTVGELADYLDFDCSSLS